MLPESKHTIYNFFFRHKGILFTACGLGLFSQVSAIVIPLCVGKFYQLSFGGQGGRSNFFDALFGPDITIYSFFVVFFLVVGVRFLLQWQSKRMTSIAGELFTSSLRSQLFEHLLKSDLTTFQSKPVGKYLLRFSGDLQTSQRIITHTCIGGFSDATYLMLAIGLVAMLDHTLALVLITGLPLALLLSTWAKRSYTKLHVAKQDKAAAHLAFVTERLQSIITIKAMNRITPEMRKYDKRAEEFKQTNIAYKNASALQSAVHPMLSYLLLGALMFTAYRIQQSTPDAAHGANLIVVIMLSIQMIPAMKRLMLTGSYYKTGSASLAKINALTQLPTEHLNKDSIHLPEASLTFKHVSFAYPQHPVIESFSCTCTPKSITWIKGDSGSGKSTLSKLAIGLLQPQSGEIKIGPHHYQDISVFALRKHVAISQADMPLLGKNVFAALSYHTDPDKRPHLIALLAKLGFADAHLLPEQAINISGFGFSEGEIQLMNIARAVFTRKPILVFDSPFTKLDTSASAHVCKLFNELKKKHTVIVLSDKPPVGLEIDHTYSLK